MKKAFGGQAWQKGFKMIITHNTGNEMREAAALMLAENGVRIFMHGASGHTNGRVYTKDVISQFGLNSFMCCESLLIVKLDI